jgi:hypothetical protein
MTTTFCQPSACARAAEAYWRRRLSGLLSSWSAVDLPNQAALDRYPTTTKNAHASEAPNPGDFIS